MARLGQEPFQCSVCKSGFALEEHIINHIAQNCPAELQTESLRKKRIGPKSKTRKSKIVNCPDSEDIHSAPKKPRFQANNEMGIAESDVSGFKGIYIIRFLLNVC